MKIPCGRSTLPGERWEMLKPFGFKPETTCLNGIQYMDVPNAPPFRCRMGWGYNIHEDRREFLYRVYYDNTLILKVTQAAKKELFSLFSAELLRVDLEWYDEKIRQCTPAAGVENIHSAALRTIEEEIDLLLCDLVEVFNCIPCDDGGGIQLHHGNLLSSQFPQIMEKIDWLKQEHLDSLMAYQTMLQEKNDKAIKEADEYGPCFDPFPLIYLDGIMEGKIALDESKKYAILDLS